MRVVIVEDEKIYSDVLTEYLSAFAKENNIDIQSSLYSNGMELLSSYQPVWDLLLLDIEMPLMDGMSLARKIRETDSDVLIIFITKTAQYAMSGYEVNALDYILKPVNYYAFSMKMRRVLNLLQTRNQFSLIVQGSGFTRKLEIETIRYIDILGHTMTYHTFQSDISSTGSRSIRELENELGPHGFARCSQSYLVNLRYVQSIEKDTVILTNGESLSISRNRRKPFMQALLDYCGR